MLRTGWAVTYLSALQSHLIIAHLRLAMHRKFLQVWLMSAVWAARCMALMTVTICNSHCNHKIVFLRLCLNCWPFDFQSLLNFMCPACRSCRQVHWLACQQAVLEERLPEGEQINSEPQHWVTWKNRSDLVLRPNGLFDWQTTRSDWSLD